MHSSVPPDVARRRPNLRSAAQEEKAQREQKKSHMARMVLAGQSSFTSDESDVFEGLTPHEIQAFVDEVRVSVTADP